MEPDTLNPTEWVRTQGPRWPVSMGLSGVDLREDHRGVVGESAVVEGSQGMFCLVSWVSSENMK